MQAAILCRNHRHRFKTALIARLGSQINFAFLLWNNGCWAMFTWACAQRRETAGRWLAPRVWPSRRVQPDHETSRRQGTQTEPRIPRLMCSVSALCLQFMRSRHFKRVNYLRADKAEVIVCEEGHFMGNWVVNGTFPLQVATGIQIHVRIFGPISVRNLCGFQMLNLRSSPARKTILGKRWFLLLLLTVVCTELVYLADIFLQFTLENCRIAICCPWVAKLRALDQDKIHFGSILMSQMLLVLRRSLRSGISRNWVFWKLPSERQT